MPTPIFPNASIGKCFCLVSSLSHKSLIEHFIVGAKIPCPKPLNPKILIIDSNSHNAKNNIPIA